MQLICVEAFLEKLEEIKAKNKDRPLGATMNMGIIQAMDVVNTLPCYELEEDDGNEAKEAHETHTEAEVL